jgi:hypothetical protein
LLIYSCHFIDTNWRKKEKSRKIAKNAHIFIFVIQVIASKKKRKQQGGNGPPTGDQPLVSIKRCGNKGLVQTTMLQFLCGRKKTKIVACDNSLSSSLLFSLKPGHEDDSDAQADLRGFQPGVDGDKIPPHYCTFCRHPPDLCHQKIFTKIVELVIMNEIYGSECEPTCDEVKELFFDEYNKALRQKVCKRTGTLDLSTYGVPYCLTANSLDTLYRYIKACKYHYELHKCITFGRNKPNKVHGKLFDNK